MTGRGTEVVPKVRVHTTPPVVSQTTANPNPAAVNTPFSIAADITDLCSNIVSAEFSLDGGLTFQPMDAIATVSVPGIANPMVLSVCVRGTDAGDNTSDSECIFLPVYDPDGGFVTGGGWINSPEGAYTADPTLTGRANFGFVSKYKKGAQTPTGVTEFHFQAGDLNFHSDSYEWLVIAGAKAQYKGVGTINGAGSFRFFLTAIDAEQNDNDAHTTDKFRIKIWSEEVEGVEEVVYDNGLGDDLDADPPTELGGGQIVIHTGKGKK